MRMRLVSRLFRLVCFLGFILAAITADVTTHASPKTEDKSLNTTSSVTVTHSSTTADSSRVRQSKLLKRVSSTTPLSENSQEPPKNEIHEKWREFQGFVKKTIDSKMKKALPKFLRLGLEAQISGTCSKSIMALVLGLRGLKGWAFRMLDATAKIPSGVLDGTLSDFGDYDQCLNIVKYKNDLKRDEVQFRGQYCTVEAKPLLPEKPHRVTFKTTVLNFSSFADPDSVLVDFASNSNMFYLMVLRLGLCLPSTCTASDVQEMTKLALKDTPLEVTVRRCEVKQIFKMSKLQIGIGSFLGFMVVLIIIGSCLDNRCTNAPEKNEKPKGVIVKSFTAFSLKKNLRKIFAPGGSKENFGVLNGTRVLSMVWVVLVHTYGFGERQAFARMKNAQEALDEVTFGTIINAWVIVDTFFVLGAFLVAYSNLKTLEREKGKLNFTRYYLHRIWRLTPPVAGVLLLMFLLPLMGSGPLWQDVVGHQVGNCQKNWWQALLIPVNTWTHFDDMCLLHTWYIASDMHFYLLSPLILFPLYRWPTLGFILMAFFTMVCMGISATLTIINDFYPTLLYFTPDLNFTKWICDLMYFRPYPHMGAYCVGLALGFLILKHRDVKIRPIFQFLGWGAAIACNSAVLYGAYEWNRGNLPNKVVDVSYAILHRTAWALGIGWLVFMCITGRGGIVNKFLSWELFTPLSRLSYSAYLLHFPVLWVRNGLKRERLLFHHYEIFYEFLATLTLTLCLSVTFHVIFEAPFLNLEEVWFPKKASTTGDPKLNGPAVKSTAHKSGNGHSNGLANGSDKVFSVRL